MNMNANVNLRRASEVDNGQVIEDGQGGRIILGPERRPDEPFRFRITLPPGSSAPGYEAHPYQDEHYRVLSGEVDLGVMNGRRVVVKAGETFTIPAGTLHQPANRRSEPCEFESVLTPGLQSRRLFEAMYRALARHRSGPGLALRMALIFQRHAQEIRFQTPMRAVMLVLAAVARLLGVRIA
jgi:mannose-6-phosphate isomerase-like protein (cupin superfamily)